MADFQSLLAKAVGNLPNRGTPALRQAIYERARIALVGQLRRIEPPLSEADIAREESALTAAAMRLEAEISGPTKPEAAAVKVAPPPPPRPAPPPPAAVAPTRTSIVEPRLPNRPAAPPMVRTLGSAAKPVVAPPTRLAAHSPTTPTLAANGADPATLAPAPMIEPPREAFAPSRPSGVELRPPAPSAREPQRRSPKLLVGLIVGLLFAGAIVVVAVMTREKPQDLASKESAEKNEPAPSGANKVIQRVKPTPNSADVAVSPASTPAASAAPAAAPSPAIASPSLTPASPSLATGPARAAMLVEVRSDPQRPAIEVGSVAWSLVPPSGAPSTSAIKAEIDVPSLKLHATMTIMKNTDASVPATHTIDIKMHFADGAEIKGVKDMGLPQLRKDDISPEEALAGVRVKTGDGNFIVGLFNGDADVARNVELLRTHNWIDLPLVFGDDRVAKLAFEKSAEGDKVFALALAAWK